MNKTVACKVEVGVFIRSNFKINIKNKAVPLFMRMNFILRKIFVEGDQEWKETYTSWPIKC